MEYNVPNTIVPQHVIDGYLNECSKNQSLMNEIFSVSEDIKNQVGCNQGQEGRAKVHVYVGPQGVGKSRLITDNARRHKINHNNEPIVIDRFSFMQQLDSFRVDRMNAQARYDGDMEKFHADLEGVTKDYLPAALWIENDVLSCAVQNNRKIFVETSGTNTLNFIDRLEAAGADVTIHPCIAPLQVLFDAADARYKKNPEFAVSKEQIEQEYNRLIEILPELIKYPNSVRIQVRQNAEMPLREAALISGYTDIQKSERNLGMLDGILGNHRMSVEKLLQQRKTALSFKVAAEAAPAATM